MPQRPKKVAICVPCHTELRSAFALCLAPLVADASQCGLSVMLNSVQGSGVCVSRFNLVEISLRQEADYLLWLDSDHTFPTDILRRLMAHEKDIVGCSYSTRNTAARRPTAITQRPDGGWTFPDLDPHSSELVEVAAFGFGAMLVKADVFRSVPRPWGFEFRYREEFGGYEGEDAGFCRAVRMAGYKLWVDPGLSHQLRHIGVFPYSLDAEADAALVTTWGP